MALGMGLISGEADRLGEDGAQDTHYIGDHILLETAEGKTLKEYYFETAEIKGDIKSPLEEGVKGDVKKLIILSLQSRKDHQGWQN